MGRAQTIKALKEPAPVVLAQPDIITTTARVSCNGGGGALGHPQIWLSLGEEGKVTCPYCSASFVKAPSAEVSGR